MTVKSVDYTSPDPAIPTPLEIIETKEQEAWDEFTANWSFDRVPHYEEIESYVENNEYFEIKPHKSLFSVLVHDADLLDLILPMDAFAEELTDDELPAHLEREELETRRLSRVVPPRSPTDDRKGYFEIYSDLIKDNEFFFLGTMSDVFLRTYKQSESGTGDPFTS